jgi:DNA end-binding protein Ku
MSTFPECVLLGDIGATNARFAPNASTAFWKGYLRLSLVSCPIALYPASSLSEKVSFNRINRKTGNRLKQQNVDSETGEVVAREGIARGYEVGNSPAMR